MKKDETPIACSLQPTARIKKTVPEGRFFYALFTRYFTSSMCLLSVCPSLWSW